MFKSKWSMILFISCGLTSIGSLHAAVAPSPKPEQTLQIDIPVKLEKANVVFNVGTLALLGDLPIALEHMDLLANDFSQSKTQGNIIAIFHTEAGHMVLRDETYNSARHIKTGNPYKQLIADLMKKGVQIELCGATAKSHNWTNADLLPGVKVNTDAMSRLTQLMQEGYGQIKD